VFFAGLMATRVGSAASGASPLRKGKEAPSSTRKRGKFGDNDSHEREKKWLPNHAEEEEVFVVQPSISQLSNPSKKRQPIVVKSATLNRLESTATTKKRQRNEKLEEEIQLVIKPSTTKKKESPKKKKRKETKEKRKTVTKQSDQKKEAKEKRTTKNKDRATTAKRILLNETVTLFPIDSSLPSAVPILVSSKDTLSASSNPISEITITMPTTLKGTLFKSFSSTISKMKEQQRLQGSPSERVSHNRNTYNSNPPRALLAAGPAGVSASRCNNDSALALVRPSISHPTNDDALLYL